ncbi:MAG TPA: carbohydrate ABC transporter permease [Acidimicrobiia bacterium]|jgi:multiple sugar transport system permease protein|nr:carbohydrate ABC transporter permease [Acidimicrobiia bacterium]
MADHVDITEVRRRARRRRVGGRVGLYTVAIGAAFMAAFPFLWSTITMFKQDPDLYTKANTPFWFTLPPTLEHLRLLFFETQFFVFVRNTVLVGLAVVTITLVFSLPAAYSLARLAGRWGERMGIAIFLVYLVPPTLLFIPMSRVVVTLGLQESLWSLVLVYPTITIPISVWLLMGFFKGIPRDIEEQAMVDGYSRVGAVVRAVMPLVFPGIVAVVVFSFTLSAHEFIYALSFVSRTAAKTISVGVPTELVRGDVFFWQSLEAAAVLVAIPIALLFNLFLDRFIKGFTLGAVKG